MPSQGDMEIVSQETGIITFKPIYYGGECAGPIIKLGLNTYRLKLRNDGKVELKKADTTVMENNNDQ